jgi:hypothetical protein
MWCCCARLNRLKSILAPTIDQAAPKYAEKSQQITGSGQNDEDSAQGATSPLQFFSTSSPIAPLS